MLIYGHRGTPATTPENTLPSIEEAIRVGVDGLEFDVRATKDSVLVLLHDRDLHRTTNGQGHIDELNVEEIRTFDAGNGAQIPTLDEVLAFVGNRVHLDIEIKQAGIESLILTCLARYPAARFLLSSFDPNILLTFREISTTVELAPISSAASVDLVEFAKTIGAKMVALLSEVYTPESAAIIAEAGLDVLIWTVNDVEEALRVQGLGANGLCTDCPGFMIEALGRLQAVHR
jgi:glycerophosphoryl diester phosphodiesterase